MERIYQACRDSGGRAASNYNAWVTQNGCICGDVASGAQTCSAQGSSAPTSTLNSNLINSSTQGVVQGIMTGDAQLTSAGFLGLIVASVLQGDPAAEAEKVRQAAIVAEQQRLAEEMHKLEYSRQQELSRQRLLGVLKSSTASAGLTVKMGDSAAPINVVLTQGAFGAGSAAPIGGGTTTVNGQLQLKLGDQAENSSAKAGQGFDEPGTILGSDLPAAPPTPVGRLTEEVAQQVTGLREGLKKNEGQAHVLSGQLALLEQAKTPDRTAIDQLKERITSNESEKKKIILDLSAEDPDEPKHDPSPVDSATAPSGGAQ